MEQQLVEIRKERENLLANLVEAEYVIIFIVKIYPIIFVNSIGNKSCFGNEKFN